MTHKCLCFLLEKPFSLALECLPLPESHTSNRLYPYGQRHRTRGQFLAAWLASDEEKHPNNHNKQPEIALVAYKNMMFYIENVG